MFEAQFRRGHMRLLCLHADRLGSVSNHGIRTIAGAKTMASVSQFSNGQTSHMHMDQIKAVIEMKVIVAIAVCPKLLNSQPLVPMHSDIRSGTEFAEYFSHAPLGIAYAVGLGTRYAISIY